MVDPNKIPHYALTLWRPWAQAIVYGPKRIENRSWKPPGHIIGERIAIHSGFYCDKLGARWMEIDGLWTPIDKKYCHPKCIIGYARVTEIVTESNDPWFTGPYGWLLDDVVRLTRPYSISGQQRLWAIPESVRRFDLAEIKTEPA